MAPGKKCEHDLSFWGNNTCNQCVARPHNRDGSRDSSKRYWAKLEKQDIHSRDHRRTVAALKVVQDDLVGANMSSDTGSSDEDVAEISAAPIPESEIMYSYDAHSGPSTGSDVLSNAIMQAVKRFENKQTEQLVKNEYDMVLDGKEVEDAYAGDAEDDFELVEYGDLH